jgi:hypothetical protein
VDRRIETSSSANALYFPSMIGGTKLVVSGTNLGADRQGHDARGGRVWDFN